ncbi:MAG: glycoside hydrolase family 3 C-terminal domain-containing protein [Clostridia bacterium]|nr:glycoside hydrolase family 3 C-terminal domain-containing protein [Clostridia bacterium]
MKKSKVGLFRGLSALLASLFVLSLCLTSVATVNAGVINRQLGTTSFITRDDGDPTRDKAYFKSEFSSVAELEAAKHELAAAIGSEGSVLLKNNGALPLQAGQEKVTVWGLNSLFPTLGGLMGSSVMAAPNTNQKAIGILDALGMKGVQLNGEMAGFYGQFFEKVRKSSLFGAQIPGHSLNASFANMYEPEKIYQIGELSAADYTDEILATADDTTAVIFLTRDSSEAADFSDVMTDTSGNTYSSPLALSEYERQMIALAKEHSNGKMIVLLNTDSPMEVEPLKQDPDIDAILWTGLPGMYGFEGVADVLVGNTAPSGRMVDTYAVSAKSAPAMVNFDIAVYDNCSLNAGSPLTADHLADWYLAETEGIYIGYKYYETRYEDAVLGQGNAVSAAGSSTGSAWNYADEVSYPFGYGMSYTTFSQELVSVDVKTGGTSTAVVKVTNTGSVAGKDVAELYVQVPYTQGGLEKAAIQLVNFGKTQVLEPGASETLTIEFDARYFASYDESLVKADGTAGAWVLDKGDYYFTLGNGAHEAVNNVLAKKLGITAQAETEGSENAFTAAGLVTINTVETINPDNVIVVALGQDNETYSANVKNALQDADLGKLIPGSVEYTTRADWTKGWTPVTGITATDEMLVGLQNRSHQLTQNDAYKVTWGASNGLTLASMMEFDSDGKYIGVTPMDDPKWDTLISQITLDEAINFLENATDEYDAIGSIGIGNVYMNDGPLGFVNDQVSGYAAKWDASMSSEPTYSGPDSEYAVWSMAEMPTEPVVAATFNQELVMREGELTGEDGLWANISGITGPGMNLHRAAYCARNHEYYSEDAMLTNRMGLAFSVGNWKKGTFTTIKHFAVNDKENNRTGLSTFFTEQGARENALRAFEGPLTSEAGNSLMTAYNRIGTIFSGGHEGLMKQILCNEWGYRGSVVSDYAAAGFDYMNWLDNIYGGGACLCTTGSYSSAAIGSMGDAKNRDVILADGTFQHEMQDVLKRFMYVFASSNAMNGLSPDTRVVHVSPWWEKALLGTNIALGVLSVLTLLGYAYAVLKSRKS